MFVKLVVMILVFGSSGVGLLSVRQSRLQAAHEMAEARLRVRMLEEQAGEIRTKIAAKCTPDRVMELIDNPENYEPAAYHRTQIIIEKGKQSSYVDNEPVQLEQLQIDGKKDEDQAWILNDGSRVIFVDR
ncbi:MAG: hypothetical protein P1U42_05760 [Phycisphaerales bacterium]|nr:hypothetical protein [Phycisphaerales bacterium]